MTIFWRFHINAISLEFLPLTFLACLKHVQLQYYYTENAFYRDILKWVGNNIGIVNMVYPVTLPAGFSRGKEIGLHPLLISPSSGASAM